MEHFYHESSHFLKNHLSFYAYLVESFDIWLYQLYEDELNAQLCSDQQHNLSIIA